jgi:zinc transport system substrate-binding protein
MRRLVALLVLFVGCSGGTEEATQTGQRRGPVGVVEVTHYPMEYVVSRIGGSRIEVNFRGRDAADPAYWRPGVDDVVAMQEADLIVVNGAGYEPWLVDVSLPVSRLVDTTAPWTDRLIALEETVTHSHGPEGDHEHGGTAFTTWLDLSLLARQSETVAAAMARRWPEHQAEFNGRATELIAELEALDAEFLELADKVRGRGVVYSHPVYQYFAARYDLAGPSLHWEPDVAPDADAWAAFDRLHTRHGFEIMVWEDAPPREVLSMLRERGVYGIGIYPGATGPSEGDLLTMLRGGCHALESMAPH